jgi:hypothetical protein
MRTKQSVRAVGLHGLSMPKSATEMTFGASPVGCVSLWLSSTVARSASLGRASTTQRRSPFHTLKDTQYCQDYASVVTQTA